jgi:hypothetical protein
MTRPDFPRRQLALRAELIGNDRCEAGGFVATAAAPVLALSRELTNAGVDPMTPLEELGGATLLPPRPQHR